MTDKKDTWDAKKTGKEREPQSWGTRAGREEVKGHIEALSGQERGRVRAVLENASPEPEAPPQESTDDYFFGTAEIKSDSGEREEPAGETEPEGHKTYDDYSFGSGGTPPRTPPQRPRRERMSRRKFMQKALGLGAAAALGALAYEAGHYDKNDYNPFREEVGKIRKAIGADWWKKNFTEMKEVPDSLSALQKELKQLGYIQDEKSGNFLAPEIYKRCLKEDMREVKIGNQTVRLRDSVALKLLAADQLMVEATGRHIKINSAFRTNEDQLEQYKDKTAKGIEVAKPGHSFHETGQAIDVSNYNAARKYLLQVGFVDGVTSERWHFSIGEAAGGWKNNIFRQGRRAWGDAVEKVKNVKDAISDWLE